MFIYINHVFIYINLHISSAILHEYGCVYQHNSDVSFLKVHIFPILYLSIQHSPSLYTPVSITFTNLFIYLFYLLISPSTYLHIHPPFCQHIYLFMSLDGHATLKRFPCGCPPPPAPRPPALSSQWWPSGKTFFVFTAISCDFLWGEDCEEDFLYSHWFCIWFPARFLLEEEIRQISSLNNWQQDIELAELVRRRILHLTLQCYSPNSFSTRELSGECVPRQRLFILR